MTAMTSQVDDRQAAEREDLLESLAMHRAFLHTTANGLTDAQAAHASTVSALAIGGLIEHVARTEDAWTDFIVRGADSMSHAGEFDPDARMSHFRMQEGETLESLLAEYGEVAERTDKLGAADFPQPSFQ